MNWRPSKSPSRHHSPTKKNLTYLSISVICALSDLSPCSHLTIDSRHLMYWSNFGSNGSRSVHLKISRTLKFAEFRLKSSRVLYTVISILQEVTFFFTKNR